MGQSQVLAGKTALLGAEARWHGVQTGAGGYPCRPRPKNGERKEPLEAAEAVGATAPELSESLLGNRGIQADQDGRLG